MHALSGTENEDAPRLAEVYHLVAAARAAFGDKLLAAKDQEIALAAHEALHPVVRIRRTHPCLQNFQHKFAALDISM